MPSQRRFSLGVASTTPGGSDRSPPSVPLRPAQGRDEPGQLHRLDMLVERRFWHAVLSTSGRGRAAVVIVTAIVVIAALVISVALSDGPGFVTGMFVGVPVGALLGWLMDQFLMRLVDAYTARLRGR